MHQLLPLASVQLLFLAPRVGWEWPQGGCLAWGSPGSPAHPSTGNKLVMVAKTPSQARDLFGFLQNKGERRQKKELACFWCF